LPEHEVVRAAELDWQELANGDLIAMAEAHGFDLLITADKNLRYQQNLTGRKLAILVLPSGRWPAVTPQVAAIVDAISAIDQGDYVEIDRKAV
jgi:hypothetical protein